VVPFDIAFDATGNLYIADVNLPGIRKVSAATGLITTLAGTAGKFTESGDGGAATKASFAFPCGITVDAAGNVFVADFKAQTLRRIDAKTGLISRVAGTGDGSHGAESGDALSTSISPVAVIALPDGSLLVADSSALVPDFGVFQNPDFYPTWRGVPNPGMWEASNPVSNRIRKLTPVGAADVLLISSGDGQNAATGMTVPVTARVVDAAGAPVEFVPVTFAITSGAAQIAVPTVITNSNGAAPAQVTLGSTPGTVTIRADSAGLSSVIFTINVVPPFLSPATPVTGLPMSNPPVTALSANALMQVSGQGFVTSGQGGLVSDGDLVNGALQPAYKGVCVSVGGIPAPILAVSPVQVIFQVPTLGPPGSTADVVLTLSCGSGQDAQLPPVTLPVQTTTPEFFYASQNADGTSLVAAMDNNSGKALGTVHPGDQIMVYLTGLGPTSPLIDPGALVTDNIGVSANVILQLGSQTITPDWVTTPKTLPGPPYITSIGENVGVYQILFTIPANAPAGNLSLVVMTDDGAMSPSAAYLVVAYK
jgi:uncharacterized protein (TIGR03437 family)